MRHRRLALTGPPVAELRGLDGFRDQIWPALWAVPHCGPAGPRVIRTRDWEEPELLGDQLVTQMPLMLRHLGAIPSELEGLDDRITARDRIELALEHALRLGTPLPRPTGGKLPGDALLNEILVLRGNEPCTESFAETRAVQFLRTLDITPWRQVWLPIGSRRFRADLMIPFRPMPRPEVFLPSHGILLECDSREWHADYFDEDQERNGSYTSTGFHWVGLTPNQIEFQPAFARKILAGALRRAGHPLLG